jgi:hypothetical protein
MSGPQLTAGTFVLILAFGILCGLALAGMMVDCGVPMSLFDAGCVCQ